jgi:pSer/pThr/pTyr-binding forkhead associated (FHA) protein
MVADMDATLRILNGPRSGETFPVLHGKLLIGREDDCHLKVESELVSRYHCVLMLDEYTLRIRDLGSKNGTFVNGRRINGGQTILLSGDIVSVASTNGMAFEIELVEHLPEVQTTEREVPADSASALEKTSFFEGETVQTGGTSSPNARPSDAADSAVGSLPGSRVAP